MDNRKHLVYNFGGEEVADDDFPECSTHSIPTARSLVFSNTEKALVRPRRTGRGPRNEVKNRMKNIGAHLNNAVLEKKKRMESYIKDVVKDCDRHIKQHWKVHQDEVRDFKIEYTEQIITLFQQWDSDMKKVGDLEDNLTNSFYQQQKTFQQIRSRQSHSLKALTQANEKFLKGMENLEKDKNSVLSSVQCEFKKQMVFLQSKITDG
ncbi:synaptonemal complex protein 3-like [Arvicanthis niloticus]|uniref:synaptonemal complex protein 3-like n=1 Tax=Arvicanthis niloticus TaxID=61156 RepID=UPI0014861877|nr:synaptonemal complex protein 3-like [Arvicanthis niloticus]